MQRLSAVEPIISHSAIRFGVVLHFIMLGTFVAALVKQLDSLLLKPVH